jgi:alanine dehydrogenase
VKSPGTLLLRRREVAQLLSLDDCIVAVEEAFRLRGEGRAPSSGTLSTHFPGGGFHIKTSMDPTHAYFAAKLNGNFPANPERFGLPTIQGVIMLCDADNGSPLAVMDSIEITILRTGAATGVAAKRMARANSTVVTICGCGNQGRVQLQAVTRVLPIQRAYAFDRDGRAAESFAREMSSALEMEVTPAADVGEAVRDSDVCVTCTPSEVFFVRRDMVKTGTFIAAVGADNPYKQEIEPELLASARLVLDDAQQCASMGELHHAIERGLKARENPEDAELAEVVAGKKPGRTGDDEITIFDSTGVALEDVAAAVMVYERALSAGAGHRVELAA